MLTSSGAKVQTRLYPGDLVTRTGDRKIRQLSRVIRELACLLLPM